MFNNRQIIDKMFDNGYIESDVTLTEEENGKRIF